MAISLSESAAQRVRDRLAVRGRGLGLRIGVKASGCSGYSYVVDYADEARVDDRVFESEGVKAVSYTHLALIRSRPASGWHARSRASRSQRSSPAIRLRGHSIWACQPLNSGDFSWWRTHCSRG